MYSWDSGDLWSSEFNSYANMFFSNTNRTNLTNLVGCDMVYFRGIREITSLWSVGLRQISWSRTSRKRSHLQIRLESLCIGKERSKKSVLKTPCASVISVSFFDLRSVAKGSQNDLLQVEFRVILASLRLRVNEFRIRM